MGAKPDIKVDKIPMAIMAYSETERIDRSLIKFHNRSVKWAVIWST